MNIVTEDGRLLGMSKATFFNNTIEFVEDQKHEQFASSMLQLHGM